MNAFILSHSIGCVKQKNRTFSIYDKIFSIFLEHGDPAFFLRRVLDGGDGGGYGFMAFFEKRG